MKKYPRLRLGSFCCLLGLWPASSAGAHTIQAPPDPAIDAAANVTISVITVGLLGIVAYYVFQALASLYEKRRGTTPNPKTTQALALAATTGAVLLLWRVVAPPAVAVDAGVHTDTPRHGGQIQSVGSNHVEAAVRPDGALALYLMGIIETVPAPVAEKTLWAQARPGDGSAVRTVMLHAAPQPGDPPGQASAFVGELPRDIAGKPVTLSVTLPLPGPSRSVRFALGRPGETPGAVPVHDTAAVMVVAAKPTAAEQKLFETPGGAYTQADIAANGDTTPDIKYAGMMANHHMHPKKGTYTCPVTRTQANAKFPWIVGGKTYLFCCPPCIAEFVKSAKDKPAGLRPPESYIQQ